MASHRGTFWTGLSWLLTAIGGALLLTLYLLTNYPSITWWIGSEYSLMAVALGVAPAPGSLLLTLIGWLAVKVASGLSQAVILNGLAGVMGVVATYLTLQVARKALPNESDEITSPSESGVKHIAILAGVLIFGTSISLWNHAIVFQPYILTTLFTGLILLSIIHWWNKAESGTANLWLFFTLLLFGLDFSVHRTNLLLLPGFLVMVLIRYPGTIKQIKSWLAGVIGLTLGLAFHFLTMLLASFKPIFSADNATTLQNFYNYVSLKQVGGGWLVNLYPRKADFLTVQLNDYLRLLADNFFVTNGPFGYFGLLTILLLIFGLIALWQHNRKLCLGLVILFLCSSLGAVIYFNTPANYHWPMDRHYLPSFVIFTIFLSVGAGRLALAAWSSTRFSTPITAVVLVLLFALPVNGMFRNRPEVDASDRYFAHDYATNILNNLEPDAILIVQGDVLWPILYLQTAENLRPDVTLLSQSLLNTPWYARQAIEMDPSLPLTLGDTDLQIQPWSDTTVTVTTLAADSTATPETVSINIPPTVADKYLMVQDWLTVRMLQENHFQRPIYFTSPIEWLMPVLQPEGLVWKIIAENSPEPDFDVMFNNLVDNYSYRGFDDASIQLDKSSERIGTALYQSHLMLAKALVERGEVELSGKVLDHLETIFPAGRLASSDKWAPMIPLIREMIEQVPLQPGGESQTE